MEKAIIMASGPVIVEDNKVLLNKHGDDKFWKFCGGRVEDFKHSLIEHARREVKEEMGLKIEILDSMPFFYYTQKRTPVETPAVLETIDVILVHYLSGRIGEIKPGSDIKEWQWIPILALDWMEKQGELAPNIIPTLKHFRII